MTYGSNIHIEIVVRNEKIIIYLTFCEIKEIKFYK